MKTKKEYTDEEFEEILARYLHDWYEELKEHTDGVKGIYIECNNDEHLSEMARVLNTELLDMEKMTFWNNEKVLTIKSETYISKNGYIDDKFN